MKLLALFTFSVLSAFSQPFTFGVKVGTPLDHFLGTVGNPAVSYHSGTQRYLIGPTAELRLPFGLGIEVDALFRHYNFQGDGSIAPGATLKTRGSTNAWEFPVLAKYRFPAPVVRPFVDAGIAWDTLQGYGQTVTVTSSVPVLPPADLNQPIHNTTKGFVLGGGLDVHAPFVHVSPEIRYTRWGAQHFFSPNGGFSSNQNQVELVVGITF